MSSLARALALATFAAAVLPAVASAAWLPGGTPLSTVESEQVYPSAVSDGAGGFIATWQDARTGELDIYAQRFTAAGNPAPGWPAGGLAVCAAAGNQRLPLIASDGAGGAVIAWYDLRAGLPEVSQIYATRITGAGELAPDWTPDGNLFISIASSCGPGFHDIIPDDQGGATLVLSISCPNNPEYGHLAHVNSSGVGDWGVDIPPYYLFLSGGPVASSDAMGGVFVATWERLSYPLKAERVSQNGGVMPGWPVLVSDLQAWGGAIAPDGSGGGFFAWPLYLGTHPQVQHLAPDGTRVPGWPLSGLPAAPAADSYALGDLVTDGSGGVIVSWIQAGATGGDVLAQRMRGDGSIAAGWPVAGAPVCRAPGNVGRPMMAPDSSGGAWIAWPDYRGGVKTIFCSHLDADGAPAPGWPMNGTILTPTPAAPELYFVMTVVHGAGTAFAIWPDGRSGSSRVYAQNLGSDGPVPVLASLVSTVIDAGRVRLSGLVGDLRASTVLLERAEPTQAWTELAVLHPDGAGQVAYDDLSVEPGRRYGYRLRVPGDGSAALSSELWVETPNVSAFALRAIGAAAVGRKFSIAFSLPDAKPAELRLLDIGGRCLFRRSVGGLGEGDHLVEIDGVLPGPGVYFVRLSRESESLVDRLVSVW